MANVYSLLIARIGVRYGSRIGGIIIFNPVSVMLRNDDMVISLWLVLTVLSLVQPVH